MLWTTYQQASKLSQRPSEMLFIEDLYTAFCFDEACLAFGSAVESAMDAVKTKGKKPAQIKGARENVLRRYVGLPRQFADITALRGREASSERPTPTEDRPEPSFKME